MTRRLLCLASMLCLLACDGETDPADAGSNVDAGEPTDGGPRLDAGTSTDAGPPGLDSGATDAGPPAACDFRAVGGIIVIEAEHLPFTEDWATGTDGEASGGEYLEWTGASHNGDSTFGRFEVAIRIETAGLYRLQMRSRVGMGTNATEHNDTWMQFADADVFYGIQGPSDMEDRVYPRPLCEDGSFLSRIEAMPDVVSASCPAGTSRDGYFKVYCSGALMWRWSTHTSDSDAHDIVMRFDAPGVYTYQLAARADFHQLDRIVIHEIGLDDAAIRDLALGETACP